MFSVKVLTSNFIENKHVYKLAFRHGDLENWEVERTSLDLVALSKKLFEHNANSVFSPEVGDAEAVAVYINNLVSGCSEKDLWNNKPLLHFIDSSSSALSKMAEIYISIIQKEVEELKAQNASYDKKIESLSDNYKQLLDLVNEFTTGKLSNRNIPKTLEKNGVNQSGVALAAPAAVRLSLVKSFGSSDVSASASEAMGTTGTAGLSAQSSFSLNEESFPPLVAAHSTSSVSLNEVDQDCGVSSAGNTTRGSESMWSATSRTSASSVSPSPTFLFSRSGSEKEGTNGISVAVDSAQTAAPAESAAENVPKSALDVTTDQVIDVLLPRDSQMVYRASVTGLIRRHTKSALVQCATYEIGMHTLCCHLPDDPLVLSVVFSKNHAPNWHKTLMNRLLVAVDRSNVSGGSGGGYYPSSKFEDSAYDGCTTGGSGSCASHVMSNVHFSDSGTGAAATAFNSTVNKQAGGAQYSALVPPTTELSYRVHCAVDAIEVDILPNARVDLCFLAFIEEVAQLVGRDNLFKRSVLLIRAWWVYETGPYVGSSIKHYITDNAMVLMVAALFNLHHREITSPVVALERFLRMYSKYDGFSEVVTLQGVVQYSSQAKGPSSQITLISPDPETHLIPATLLDKYYRLVNAVNGTVSASTTALLTGGAASLYSQAKGRRSPSPEEDSSDGAAEAAQGSASTTPTAAASAGASNGVTAPIKPVVVMMPVAKAISITVERSGYNVLNPFTHSNLIPEKMTTRRVVLIHKAFQIGVANLTVILNAAATAAAAASSGEGAKPDGAVPANEGSDNKEACTPAAATSADGPITPKAVTGAALSAVAAEPDMRLFFPTCMARFRDHWRPDSFSNITGESPDSAVIHRPEPFPAIRDRLWQQVQYCNFVLESVVTESVIVAITVDALTGRAALPVGEIGKMLTDLSSITHLSQRLKEMFGGLKKLLESYSELFLIAANHQFNPHVVLRTAITPEQEHLILNGVFPAEIFAKTSKQPKPVVQPLMLNDLHLNNQQPQHGGYGIAAGSNGGGHSLRASSPSSAMHPQQQQQQMQSYLAYNVNTSLDRRMRQQMNAPSLSAGMMNQQQQPQQPQIRGGQKYPQAQGQQQPLMLSNPANMQSQFRKAPQQQINGRQQQLQGGGLGAIDWSDLDTRNTPTMYAQHLQQQKLLQQQQQGRSGRVANGGYPSQQSQQQQLLLQQQQQQQQRGHSSSALQMQGGGLGAAQQAYAQQFRKSASVPVSPNMLNPAANQFVMGSASRQSSGGSGGSGGGLGGGNFYLGEDEGEDDLEYLTSAMGGSLRGHSQHQQQLPTSHMEGLQLHRSQQKQQQQQNMFFGSTYDVEVDANCSSGGALDDPDIDYLAGSSASSMGLCGGGSSLLSGLGGDSSGLWGESSAGLHGGLFTGASPPSTSSWLMGTDSDGILLGQSALGGLLSSRNGNNNSSNANN